MDLIPRRYLDNMFDDFMPSRIDHNMKCDIYEKEGNYHIEMDLPGFKKEEISIEAKDGYLTIKATKKNEVDEKDEERNYVRRERSYGSYERTFSLGDLDEEKIDASFADGILKISIPKKVAVDNKKIIEIK